MTTRAQNNTPEGTLSEVDRSSASSLTARIKHLEGRRDFWDSWYFWLIGGTAVLVAATVSVQVIGRNISKNLALAQAELIREKDRQLSTDLRAKDVEIQTAKKTASKADERAGEANKAAGEAKERAATLEVEAAAARRATQELSVAAEQLRKENVAAALALEKEKRDRLELEASLSDRIFQDQGASANALSVFAGTVAFVEYQDNAECKGAAEQINFVLRTAKWPTFGSPGENGAAFFEGVTVSVGDKELMELMRDGRAMSELRLFQALRDKESRSIQPADSLVAELNQHGIEARRHASDARFPAGTLVVRVGLKPNPLAKRTLALPRVGVRIFGNRSGFDAPIPK